MALYFGLIFYIGFYFRKENKDVASFLRARGSLPWFWVGASAFVSQFSAWSFTTGAAEAYTNGYNILITFWANAISFVIAGFYFAQKFRQLRVNNATEAVQMRFGTPNALVLSICNIPNLLIYPAFWLSGLATFMGAALGIHIKYLIIIIGLITVLMATLGGIWAIVASDFIQTIIIIVMSIACAVVAFIKFHEIGGMFELIPLVKNFEPKSSNNIGLYLVWVFYMFMQKFAGTNNFNNVTRFNAVDSSKGARKAAFFTAGIYVLGTLIWFVPVWFISIEMPDLASVYPNIARPNQTAYLAFVQNYMPVGVLGIVIIALFSATMSSIDSSLNWCTGYVLTLLPQKYKNNIKIGRTLTVVFGLIIVFLTLYLDNLWGVSFFDLTYLLIGYLYLPLIIPIFLSLWIKRTPDWGFLASILVGLALSWYLATHKELWNNILTMILNIAEPSKKDITHITLFINFMLQIFITGGTFVCSSLFYKRFLPKKTRLENIQHFYTRLNTPVEIDKSNHVTVRLKFSNINQIAIIVGLVVLEIFLFSNSIALLVGIVCSTIVGVKLIFKKYLQ